MSRSYRLFSFTTVTYVFYKTEGIHKTQLNQFLLSRLCSFQTKESSVSGSSNILSILKSKIKTSGPVTVADYMKIVLTNPSHGYYMNRDVFGKQGDFTTSPEISQLFGEMIAIWFINEWARLGRPKPLQIIELGPGRGTMISDILRVFSKLRMTDQVSCHLVEISSELSTLQSKALCEGTKDLDDKSPCYKTGMSNFGIPVHWYKSAEDVPHQFSCIVAHEFFDALPIHKFQKTKDGWREVLVDFDPTDENKLRYVISRMPTPASTMFVKKEETREHVEVCPQAGVIAQHLATRMREDGGIGLIIDYGHSGEKTDTFRAFRQHKLHDALEEPGTADLTADVDFGFLKEKVSDQLFTLGPVTQRDFLLQIHIEKRLEVLLKSCKDEEKKAELKSGFSMITDEDKMGNCFKFFALYPLVLKNFLLKLPPPGFIPPEKLSLLE
ncbi:protein arginine methyltransferase NDUFAF7, mitochondrial [Macrosteles quadrilineatus]|uniref:protein arginine methyltransferase NDUFAF7, mitochondrial n=1 Tax=Macrosteles quadrilineatus TaxID=74068 RepID=UPI0023E0C7F2|nr:protein arginine methyltransferase NDUFAF7, mitochondrial [Macrosteles quadrilineatus]